MRWSKSRNRGIVWSAEELSNAKTNIAELGKALEQEGYSPQEVKIVATYRRAYEWLYSVYVESHKQYTKVFPSFVEWIDDFRIESPSWRHPHQITRVVERYRRRFSNVHIVDYHDDSKSLLVKFFCEALENADNTCGNLARRENMRRTVNVGHHLEYRRLLLAAVERGILTDRLTSKVKVVNELERRVRDFYEGPPNNSRLEDLPRDCVTEEHRSLLFDVTWDEERQIMPYMTQRRKEEELRDAYREWSSGPSMPLCSIDTERLLKEEKWIRFFKGLSVDLDVQLDEHVLEVV